MKLDDNLEIHDDEKFVRQLQLLHTRLIADQEGERLRLAQEALANVLRHAQATKVWVKLQADRDFISLTVKDDEIGFAHTPQLGTMNIDCHSTNVVRAIPLVGFRHQLPAQITRSFGLSHSCCQFGQVGISLP